VLSLFALVFYGSPVRAQNVLVLVGEGSSIPSPLYSRWTREYGKRNPHIQMTYVILGTGEGITEISNGTGDFGAGEAPLTAKEREVLNA
jgi:phosphate transport system substrate-binding protein